MSLIRVRCPGPFAFNHSTTFASNRTLTGIFRRNSRSRTISANCAFVNGGMPLAFVMNVPPCACRAATRRIAWRSFSVHRLLLIASELMLLSASGRDDPDNFFAMMVLSVHTHHKQHAGGRFFELNRSNRMPPLLTRVVNPVGANHAQRIFKHQRSNFE